MNTTKRVRFDLDMGLHSPTQLFIGPSSEISAVVSQCAKYGDIRGYERLKDYYTKEKMQYFLVTFNHERDVDAAVKALRHKKKSGGGIWFCDKIPRRKYVDVAFMRNGGK